MSEQEEKVTTESTAPGETEATTEPRRESVADAGALYVGVSRPQDEYGRSVTDRDAMTDDELRAMGVEPDVGPSNTLIATFAVITVLVGIAAVWLAAYLNGYGHRLVAERSGNEDAIHAEKRVEAESVLTAYGVVEEGESTYRIPVDRALAVVASNPSLLERHPLGAEIARIAPAPAPVVEGSGEGSGEAASVPSDDPTAATAPSTTGQE